MPIVVIVQGPIIYQNLYDLQLSEEWLLKKLNRKQAALEDIAFAQVQSNNSLYISYENTARPS